MKEITGLSGDDIRERLEAVFGEHQLHARFLEDYSNLMGSGYFATYLHEEEDGTLDKILEAVALWLRRIGYRGDIGKYEFGLFKKGWIHKRWCIDLAWGWGFAASTAKYYVELKERKV